MTIPSERTRSLLITEQFLKDLLDTKKTPRVPKAVREQAARCLRHHPGLFDLVYLAEAERANGASVHQVLDPRTLEEESQRRDRVWSATRQSPQMLSDVVVAQGRDAG